MSTSSFSARNEPQPHSTATGNSSSSSTTEASPGDANWRRYRFRLLYDEHHDDLWRYCLRRAATVQEAEEALSETFAVAWRRLDAVPQGEKTRPWLFGVARNQLRSGWRRFRRVGELHDRLVHVHTVEHAADPAVAATDGSAAIVAALHTLREKDQEILRLAAWEELPHAEIARLLGCSENAVTVRLHRARARLTTALEKLDAPTQSNRKREKVKGPTPSPQVDATDPDTTTQGGHR